MISVQHIHNTHKYSSIEMMQFSFHSFFVCIFMFPYNRINVAFIYQFKFTFQSHLQAFCLFLFFFKFRSAIIWSRKHNNIVYIDLNKQENYFNSNFIGNAHCELSYNIVPYTISVHCHSNWILLFRFSSTSLIWYK